MDEATAAIPAYYRINCAHPTHFEHVLAIAAEWLTRIRALRANASRQEPRGAERIAELDAGDPMELAKDYGRLKTQLARLTVMGGCCGTDHRHVERIAESCSVLFRSTM